MNEEKKKHVWEALDYKHDAIIEASAGTGKTYALEHIVKHLVETNGIGDIRNLLLVTFTEKAAGELKERIRKILVDANTKACSSAAQHLDETTICTIHSFCQELLREYPFESGMQMASDVVSSDRALIERAVQSVITRAEFKEAFGDDFASLMKEPVKFDDVDKLSNALCEALGKVVASGMEVDGWRAKVFNLRLPALDPICESMPGVAENKKPGEYVLAHTGNGATLGARPKDNTRYREWFASLDSWITHIKDNSRTLENRLENVAAVSTFKMGFTLYKWDAVEYRDAFFKKPGLEPYKQLVDWAIAVLKGVGWTIDPRALGMVYDEYLRLKKRLRIMTFDDMVLEVSRMVKDAVNDVGNAAKQSFLNALRMRYRIVLVDEFQDTDDKQWNIFKLLFSCKEAKIEGANPEEGCLIVVGDPKQAIYGFRGADIGTYLTAKKEIEEGGGRRFQLKEMFRSTKEMVNAFNAIFKADGWFTKMSANGLPIRYTEEDGAVSFPDNDAPEELRGFKYPDGEKPVEFLEAIPTGVSVGDKSRCLPLYLENMVKEMAQLHESEFWMGRKDPKDRMDWSSMCVLVRSHSAGDAAQKALRAKGIPCRKYKEAGLFASAESESILALFDYLSLPRKSGNLAALLLTPFFGVTLSEIEKRLEDGDRKFDELCDRWRTYISKCEWVKFFESAMNDTDLGRPHVGDADFVRHRAGIRQIFDQLLRRCGRARDLSAFSDALRLWRRDDSEADEAGSVRNKESEADAVQIMTMHAAKGLEFNAVFVPYGFTQVPKEEEMEIRRLLYVALTRAKYKLYLPWSKRATGVDSWKPDTALNTFLGRGILALYADAKDRVKGRDALPEKQIKAGEKLRPADLPQHGDCPELPLTRGMKGWRFKWDSFSSLNHHSAKKPAGDTEQKSLVPKGALSGTVFHEVMEALCKNSKDKGEVGFDIGKENDFEKLVAEPDDKESPLLELVRRRLAANGVVNQVRKEDGETTASVIARMAWNALRTELDFGGGNKFRLCDDIPLKDRKAEVNFVLDESLLGGVRGEGAGALNGSIDLLVRRDDGYYIVDWKTNSLDNYEKETVKTAMDEAGYHLQYQIYTLAAEKWLGDKAVKGIAYLFVRNGETGTNESGKFVQPMSADERAKLVGEFQKKVDDSDKNEDEDNEEEQ